MKFTSLLPLACLFVYSAASAQTAPARAAAPATMAAPTTERSSMTTAAEGTGTVATDYTKSKQQGQSKMKTGKTKSSDATSKMKTKM